MGAGFLPHLRPVEARHAGAGRICALLAASHGSARSVLATGGSTTAGVRRIVSSLLTPAADRRHHGPVARSWWRVAGGGWREKKGLLPPPATRHLLKYPAPLPPPGRPNP